MAPHSSFHRQPLCTQASLTPSLQQGHSPAKLAFFLMKHPLPSAGSLKSLTSLQGWAARWTCRQSDGIQSYASRRESSRAAEATEPELRCLTGACPFIVTTGSGIRSSASAGLLSSKAAERLAAYVETLEEREQPYSSC